MDDLSEEQKRHREEHPWPSYMGLLAQATGALDPALARPVRFLGNEYILTSGGSIATREAYRNGEVSFAHLFADGTILRYGTKIGTRDDLEFLDTPPAPQAQP